MPFPPFARLLALPALLLPAVFPSPTHALPTARLTAAAPPVVKTARCETGTAWRCHPGHTLVLRGRFLGGVRSVAFAGDAGPSDDRLARARRVAEHRVVVTVPEEAGSGLLRVRDEHGAVRTREHLELQRRPPVRERSRERVRSRFARIAFPIDGSHDMGRSVANSFGGGRGHQGHDLFADCGTRLVAATDATVQANAHQSAAGHYVVLQHRDGRSFAYMHLRSASSLSVGERVQAGDPVGRVGQTGRASGCHLHFELWTAPGWYQGGQAVDPLPLLSRWRERAEG